jgi:formamidopyrimidine-DNA glycosylase
VPELPEVEAGRRIAERVLAGRKIACVHTVQDTIVYHGIPPRTFAATLKGRTVIGVHRKGKQLWMELDRRPWPGFHFGMTGSFQEYSARQDRPAFWKIELITTAGQRLAMINKRRLGRIRLFNDPVREDPIAGLGFDPLYEMQDAAGFVESVRKRKVPIKVLLLDQSFTAGVGNWIADEVLYQARIAPRRRADQLSRKEVQSIRACLKRIIHRAVQVDADAERFPRTWLFHHRWGKKKSAVTARGEKVRFDTIGGRTTAWVPDRQV